MNQSQLRIDQPHLAIRSAEVTDRHEIIDAYAWSQRATGIPSPEHCPPDMLGERLYQRQAVGRFVADCAGVIVGHGLVELPNPDNINEWVSGSRCKPQHLLELGGAFVHPDYAGQGFWTSLLEHRLEFIRSVDRTAVTATWSQNEHVRRVFERSGAKCLGEKAVAGGEISLYRFD